MKKVMLVDDIDISNFIVKKLISKVSPVLEIFDYTLPGKALKELNSINPDIIFLDLNMPIINGWQFLDEMNKMNISTSVYILTSSTCEIDAARSKSYSNVQDFLVKPINLSVLNKVLQNLPDPVI